MRYLLWLALLASCKPFPKSLPQTIGSDSYTKLMRQYDFDFHISIHLFLEDVIEFEQQVSTALRTEKFSKPQKTALQQRQHHARSLIAAAKELHCLKYDEGYKRTVVDEEKICAIFLHRLRAMQPDSIDPNFSNSDFYQRVLAEQSIPTSEAKRQVFFRRLVTQVIASVEENMVTMQQVFPFNDCMTMLRGLGNSVWKKTHCQDILARKAAQPPPQKIFYQPRELATTVNSSITALNTQIAALQELVSAGADGEARGAKKNFFIFNATNLEDNAVIKNLAEFNATITESAQQGIIPLFFTKNFRKHSGKIALHHSGSWFGLRAVKYDQLKQVNYIQAKEIVSEVMG